MIEYVEGTTSIYQLDHVLRPQYWYLTDRHGDMAVKMLFDLKDIDRIYPFVPGLHAGEIKKINTTQRFTTELRPLQKEKIMNFYKEDYTIRQSIMRVDTIPETFRAPQKISATRSKVPGFYPALNTGV